MKELSTRDRVIVELYKRGYRCNKEGEIISARGTNLKFYSGLREYFTFNVRCIKISRVRKVYSIRAHRFIAYCKYKEKLFEVDCVRHLNGDPLDNSWDNIVIGSFSENSMDIPEELRLEKARNAARVLRKLTEDEVKQLRSDREEGFKYSELCDKYGISKSAVSYIVNRKTYPAMV